MKIGVSTATLFERQYNEDALTTLNNIDACVCEIFFESFSEYKNDFSELLKSRLGNLTVNSVHTLCTQFEPQLFSVNDRCLNDAYAIFEGVLTSAKILSAKNYIMHGRARIKKNVVFNDYKHMGECFQKLCSLTEKYGINLCLENVEWAMYSHVGFFNEIKKFAPKLKTCLDIKQARISGYDYRDYLNEMGDSLKTVHISDFNENGKVCLPGKGLFDFKELFSRLNDIGYNGNLIIEVYKDSFSEIDELKESLIYLRNLKNEV